MSDRAVTTVIRRARLVPMDNRSWDSEDEADQIPELLARIKLMKMEPGDRAYLIRGLNRLYERVLLLAFRAVEYSATNDPRLARFQGILQELRVLLTQSRTAERYGQEIEYLHETIHRDPLTGLYNKSWLRGCLQQVHMSEGRSRWCSLAIMVLRGFKAINDGLGHETGDRVLREIGRIMDANIRGPNRTLARCGGDEFGFLVPQTPSIAYKIGERVRSAIRDFEWATLDPRLQKMTITADIGIACLRLGSLEERHFLSTTVVDRAFQAADQLMYDAKGQELPHCLAAVFHITPPGYLTRVKIEKQ